MFEVYPIVVTFDVRDSVLFHRAFINRRSELFEEFQTMKGTRNVTAAQTASGEVARGVCSFFLFAFTVMCVQCVVVHFAIAYLRAL